MKSCANWKFFVEIQQCKKIENFSDLRPLLYLLRGNTDKSPQLSDLGIFKVYFQFGKVVFLIFADDISKQDVFFFF